MTANNLTQYKKVIGNPDYPTRDSNMIDMLQPVAASPIEPFGYDPDTTSGLTLGYFGGQMLVDGVLTTIAAGTVVLTGSTTNYIEATRAGVLSANASAFTAGSLPLYTAVTTGSAISSLTDVRGYNQPHHARLALATTGGTTTLTYAQARVQAIDVSGTLTSNATVVVPAAPWAWAIYNGTSGAYSLTVKVSGQTGVTVPAGKRRLCICNATDVAAFTGYVASDGDTMTGLLTLSADPSSALHAATKQYVDGLVTGLLDDRGNHDASGNAWPSSGGSGTAGAILKGDLWRISVAGTLGGTAVQVGDAIRALVDTPGTTASNWAILEGAVVAASDTVSGIVELATTAEAQTGTDTARAVTPAGLAAAACYQGKRSIYLPAAALRPRVTNGCGTLATTTGASNQPDIDYLPFDGAAAEYAKAVIRMPTDWNASTLTAKFDWRRASGTGAANVVWGIRAVCVADNESPAANFGTGATVTDAASTTAANFNLSSETSACTVAGTPAAGELMFLEVYRDGASGSDSLDAVDAWLSGVVLYYTTNAKVET